MERNNQVIRILKIMAYLEAYPLGLTVKEFQDRLLEDGIKTSIDSIYRDLKAIEGVGAPLAKVEDKYKFEFTAELSKNIKFQPKDLISLFIIQESIKAFEGSPVFEDLNGFFLKLRKLLRVRDFNALKEYQDAIGFQHKATWQTGISRDLLDTVHAACIEHHLLELDYKSNHSESEPDYVKRTLGPEKIYFADSSVYLVAKDTKDGLVKTYNLHRARAAVMLEASYTPQNIKTDQLFQDSLGVLNTGEVQELSLFIEEPLASYVAERTWHPSQTWVRNPEGLHFKMTVKINDEVARWVLSLSPCCKVLSPPELQNQVVTLMQQNLLKYQDKKAA
jgi:predicted DNA-binding transcriptional regulator YafY